MKLSEVFILTEIPLQRIAIIVGQIQIIGNMTKKMMHILFLNAMARTKEEVAAYAEDTIKEWARHLGYILNCRMNESMERVYNEVTHPKWQSKMDEFYDKDLLKAIQDDLK